MFASHMQPKSSDDTSTMQPLILPEFDALPNFHEFTGCAWGVWGPDDQLGTVNLLTEEVVKQAAMEEIRSVAFARSAPCFEFITSSIGLERAFL